MKKVIPRAISVRKIIASSVVASDNSEDEYDIEKRREEINNQTKYIWAIGLRDHFKEKSKWSGWLLAAVLFLILFQSLIISLVGADVFHFEKYKWLLPLLLVQNFAQIIGLALVVVKSLFNDMNKNLPVD